MNIDHLTLASHVLFGDPTITNADFSPLKQPGPLVQRSLEILNHSIQTNQNLKDHRICWNRQKIIELNSLLKQGRLGDCLKEKWGLQDSDIGQLSAVRLQVPLSRFQKALSYLKILARINYLMLGIFLEAVSVVLASTLNLFAYISFDPKQPTKNQVPIILVHGMHSNQSIWLPLRFMLHMQGYHSIYAMNLDESCVLSQHPAEVYTNRLQAKIDDVLAKTGQEKVILISHSLGGVISTDVAAQGKVKAVITLASPLKGTRLVNFAEKYIQPWSQKIGIKLNSVSQQLKVGSEVLQRIVTQAESLEHAGICQFYHMRSSQDLAVIGKETEFISKNLERRATLHHVGHIGIMFSPYTFYKIRQWLKSCSKT